MKMAGQFDFYKVFSSHMVLQRKRPIIFSGTAEAGKNILLTFAGIRVATNVDENGVWHAKFPAMEAGGPYTAKLSGDEITSPITLHDILIGDVWMCAGQSNMARHHFGVPAAEILSQQNQTIRICVFIIPVLYIGCRQKCP